jgi:4-amino-4-deoxy-L-arabinose transferase-like glycosyltransferase
LSATPLPPRWETAAPFAVFLVALAAALAMALLRPPDPAEILSPLNDSADYDHLARSLMEGHFSAPTGEPTAFRPPLYPLFLAQVYGLAGVSNFKAVAIAQAFLAAAHALLLWTVAQRAGLGSLAALLAGLAAGLHPAFVFQVPQVLGEVLHRAWQAVAVFALLEALRRRRWRVHVAAGVAFGIAVLSKPTLIASAPFVALWLLWGLRRGGAKWREALLAAALFAGCAGGTTMLWTVRNYLVSGAFIPVSTNFPVTFAQGVTRHSWHAARRSAPGDLMPAPDDYLRLTQLRAYRGIAEERAVGAQWKARAEAHIAAHPGWFARLTVRKALQFWSPFVRNSPAVRAVAFAAMAPVLIGGWWFVAMALRRRDGRLVFALLCLAVALPAMLPHALSQPDVRYRLSLAEPLWIVMAAGTAEALWRRWRRRE